MSSSRRASSAPVGWFRRGGWYFVVTVASGGLLAWVPFTHAARRTGSASRKRHAFNYGGAAAVLMVLISLTPTDAEGDPVGTTGTVLDTITTLIALAIIIGGIIQQVPLRRAVFADPGSSAPDSGQQDPAVAAVLAARQRREQARALAARDPLMARELGIGRPDQERTYDDGGLVDLNHAPAAVIAPTCGIDQHVATAIVQHRPYGGFSSVEEMLVLLELPMETWDPIRDRAVLVPSIYVGGERTSGEQ